MSYSYRYLMIGILAAIIIAFLPAIFRAFAGTSTFWITTAAAVTLMLIRQCISLFLLSKKLGHGVINRDV